MAFTVVIAPDSFKGTLRAADAARAIADGWAGERPDDPILLRPMADGGEGTLDAFALAHPSAVRMPVTVTGPDGSPRAASWLLLPDGTGIVELASTSGIELLGERRMPWDAGTRGFGEAIAAALDHGVERLVLGIGSSASTDGGAGMLVALGARILDAAGGPVAPGARGLRDASALDLAALRPPPPGGALVLSDVTSPLLGPAGAAAVFGPQKGLDPADVPTAEAALERFARLVDVDPATPGAGAAGGTGFALLAWGAHLAPGAERVAELVGIAAALAGAGLVITGEGGYDTQTAAGKAPETVRGLAADAGVPAALVAGRIDTDPGGYVRALALTALAGSAESAMAEPGRWLREAGAELARGVR